MTKSKRNLVKGVIVSLAMLSGCDDGVNRDYTANRHRMTDAEERDETSEQNRSHVQRNLYPNFRFQNELDTIRAHAQRIGADERLMLAIREAENGRAGRQFGIMPNGRYRADNGYTENGQIMDIQRTGSLISILMMEIYQGRLPGLHGQYEETGKDSKETTKGMKTL